MKASIITLIALLVFGLSFSQVNFEKKYTSNKTEIRSVAFSPDGKYILSASNNYVNLFHTGSTDKIHFSIKTGLHYINSIQFVAKNVICITREKKDSYYYDNIIQYVNVSNKRVYKTFYIDKSFKKISKIEAINDTNSIALINEGKLYYINDTTIKVLDNVNEYTDLDFSIKTKSLYATTKDGKVIKFNMYNFQFDEIFKIDDLKFIRICVSSNGEKIAVADKNKNLFILDKKKNYAPIQLNKNNFSSQFNNLTFSPDSKFLASSNKNKFQIWKVDDNYLSYQKKVKKSAYYISDIQFDPNGKYLIISNLGTKKIELWNCQKLGIRPNVEFKNEKDKSPPQIMVTNPRLVSEKVSVINESINLEGITIDNFGTKTVSINGAKCQLSSTGGFEINMNLSFGNNPVTIIATDINGNVETKTFTIVRKEFDLDALSFESKNHLLIISIDKYADWPQLNNAVSDANLLKDVLAKRYNFNKENIYTIQDSMASKQNIINGFKKLIANVAPNDKVIIYYSGHGYYDAEIGEGYWVPYEAIKGNDAGYLPNSFMMQLMKRINAKHLFLIADACFSGSLFSSSNRGYTENVGNFKSRWGLASGRLELVSDGQAGTQSPFNKHLVEFLLKNQKETFAVSELVQYVKIHVADETDQAPVGNPLQNIGDEGGEFIFKLEN